MTNQAAVPDGPDGLHAGRCGEPGLEGGITAVLAEDRRQQQVRLALALSGIALLAVSFAACGGFEARRYDDALRTLRQLLADAMPPDFTRIRHWTLPLGETLAMSIAATLIGATLALPAAILAAAPAGAPWLVAAAARLVLNASRSVPELVLGVVFVASVGFGPLAGVLALACHSVGMLGKFTAEHLEHLDPAPAAALRAQGTSRAGVVRFCLIPQVMPRLIDLALYRWEHNVRAASVMGMVGAGGLGREIVAAFSLFEYQEALALLILILAVVTTIDALSRLLRRRLSFGT